jgi:hypothetical protein
VSGVGGIDYSFYKVTPTISLKNILCYVLVLNNNPLSIGSVNDRTARAMSIFINSGATTQFSARANDIGELIAFYYG